MPAEWRETYIRVQAYSEAYTVPAELQPKHHNQGKFLTSLLRQLASATKPWQVIAHLDGQSGLSGSLNDLFADYGPWEQASLSSLGFWQNLLTLNVPTACLAIGSWQVAHSADLQRMLRSLRELGSVDGAQVLTALQRHLKAVREARSRLYLLEDSPGKIIRFDPNQILSRALTQLCERLQSQPRVFDEYYDQSFRNIWGCGALGLLPASLDDFGVIHIKFQTFRLRYWDRLVLANALDKRPPSKALRVFICAPSLGLTHNLAGMISEIWALEPQHIVWSTAGGYHPLLQSMRFLTDFGAETRVWLNCDEALTFQACIAERLENLS